MLASLSSSSISLATVTPSLVTVGEPQLFSMTTLRPRGPRVTFTALARMFRPRAISLRALAANTMSLAAMWVSLLENGEDVLLAQDQVFLAVELHFGARVLGEQDAVAGLHLRLAQRAVVEDLAGADGHHAGLDGLLLRGVGDEEASGRLLLALQALYEYTIVERTNGHNLPSVELARDSLATHRDLSTTYREC